MSERCGKEQGGPPCPPQRESLAQRKSPAQGEARRAAGDGGHGRALEAEVALLRALIRSVVDRLGEDDPAKALQLMRQGVDTLCRALRTERVLQGDAADSLAEAFAVALREIGEELGSGER